MTFSPVLIRTMVRSPWFTKWWARDLSGWDADLGWQKVIVVKEVLVQEGIRGKIKHKPKPWPGGKEACGAEKRRCRLALLFLLAHIIKRRSLSWSVGSVRPEVLIFLLLGQPSVSEKEPESLNAGSRCVDWFVGACLHVRERQLRTVTLACFEGAWVLTARRRGERLERLEARRLRELPAGTALAPTGCRQGQGACPLLYPGSAIGGCAPSAALWFQGHRELLRTLGANICLTGDVSSPCNPLVLKADALFVWLERAINP
ncbi:uncharacterized protein LOC141581430 [Saimiri boliviensis]|uniref:uncharacterized protein LOC141581430 n=1 Tax=Saimiri boliviensis TaxID=27679 RepID=UPI003D7724BC